MITIISVEDKLELFTKVVVDKFNKEYNDRVKLLDKENTKKIEGYYKIVEEKSENYFKEMIKDANDEKKKIITSAKSTTKNEILLLRRDIINNLIDKLKYKISVFMSTPEYIDYIEKTLFIGLKDLEEEESLVIELSSKDHKGKEFIESKIKDISKDITINVSDDNQLGGIIFYDTNKRYKLDYSLEQLIELKKDYIGKVVFDLINEAGDKYE